MAPAASGSLPTDRFSSNTVVYGNATEDLQDLIHMSQEGTSIVLPALPHGTITVLAMPTTVSDSPNDEDILVAAGYYSTDWASRRSELNDMLDLEGSNISVVWQYPDDRRAILLANQRDIVTAVARQLQHDASTASTTAPTTSGDTPLRHTTIDPGLQRLVHLLDLEAKGDIAWLTTAEREAALPARLSHFREQDMADISRETGNGTTHGASIPTSEEEGLHHASQAQRRCQPMPNGPCLPEAYGPPGPLAPSLEDGHTQPVDIAAAYFAGAFTAEAHTGSLDTPFASHASGPDSTQDVEALLWPGDLMPEWLGTDTSNSEHQGGIQLETQAASSTCEATPPATHYYDDFSIDSQRLLARSRVPPLHEPAG